LQPPLDEPEERGPLGETAASPSLQIDQLTVDQPTVLVDDQAQDRGHLASLREQVVRT
jgi:hypothetical protein